MPTKISHHLLLFVNAISEVEVCTTERVSHFLCASYMVCIIVEENVSVRIQICQMWTEVTSYFDAFRSHTPSSFEWWRRNVLHH
jgi:hypothetical protein